MSDKITRFDIVDYLKTEEDITLYLEEAMQDNNPNILIAALGDIARARSINKISKDIGVNRVSLYKSLSGKTKVSFETIYKLIDNLGFRMQIVPK